MAHMHLGDYEVVSHLETPECSLRLLKLTENKFVYSHHHHKTVQTYFVLEGIAQATVDGEIVFLKPYQILRVPVDSIHSIRAEEAALVLSISIPPLEGTDQHLVMEY